MFAVGLYQPTSSNLRPIRATSPLEFKRIWFSSFSEKYCDQSGGDAMQYNSELQQIRTQRFAYLVLSCGLTVTLASPKGKHPKLSPALGSPQRRPVVGMRFRCSERFEAWTLQPSRGPCVPMLMAERLGSCTVEG